MPRLMIDLPCAASALARASTSNAVSVPSVFIRSAICNIRRLPHRWLAATLEHSRYSAQRTPPSCRRTRGTFCEQIRRRELDVSGSKTHLGLYRENWAVGAAPSLGSSRFGGDVEQSRVGKQNF